MMYTRLCPKCDREIKYRSQVCCIDANEKQRLCKSCTAKRIQSEYTPEKRQRSIERNKLTRSQWTEEYRQEFVRRVTEKNRETYKTLPEKWVNSTLKNPEWYKKISETPKEYSDPVARVRKIVETKVGMSYDQWEIVRGEYEVYANKVRTVTINQPLHTLENYGKGSSYHLDHMFSVVEGFRQGIEPELIGSIVNLRYIPAEENLAKRDKCSLTLEELRLRFKANKE